MSTVETLGHAAGMRGTARKKEGWLNGLKRLLRLRLLIPMKRGAHMPEFTARGVAVGVFWAMTPTFGIQMALVLGHWLVSRRLFRWDFSLVNGMAWTWTTNALTIFPVYYLFYISGQFLLGNSESISGYGAFGDSLTKAIDKSAPFLTQIGQGFSSLMTDVGWPILVGSIPWAFVSAFAAYAIALRFVRRYRDQRLAKFEEARATRLG